VIRYPAFTDDPRGDAWPEEPPEPPSVPWGWLVPIRPWPGHGYPMSPAGYRECIERGWLVPADPVESLALRSELEEAEPMNGQ
jgi:hypothetical protein